MHRGTHLQKSINLNKGIMEQISQYLNFDFLCKLAAVGGTVMITQKIVGASDKKGYKNCAKNFTAVVGGVVLGSALHTGVVSHVFPHGHVVSSATKAGLVKASDTSTL